MELRREDCAQIEIPVLFVRLKEILLSDYFVVALQRHRMPERNTT